MRVLVKRKSALGASTSYVEIVWGRRWDDGNEHGTLRRWSESWVSTPVVGDNESKIEAMLERHRQRDESAVALTAEHVAALARAVGQIRLPGISGDEYVEDFVDGWSTTLTIEYGYNSLEFGWSNDDLPAEWIGVAALLDTIRHVENDLL